MVRNEPHHEDYFCSKIWIVLVQINDRFFFFFEGVELWSSEIVFGDRICASIFAKWVHRIARVSSACPRRKLKTDCEKQCHSTTSKPFALCCTVGRTSMQKILSMNGEFLADSIPPNNTNWCRCTQRKESLSPKPSYFYCFIALGRSWEKLSNDDIFKSLA